MARIYTSKNDILDFCIDCFPDENIAEYLYSNLGECEHDNRGNCYTYDAEHPDYSGESYLCIVCHQILIDEDN